MDELSKEELQARVKQFTQSKITIKESSNLNIEETEDGFKIGNLVCTGLPKNQSLILLLLCNGLTHDQCAAALNVSFSHVSHNIHQICLNLLGSNANGNPHGFVSEAVLRAFNWRYLYYENISVFKLNQLDWELLTSKFSFAELPDTEAARLVFVEGMKIDEAAIQACIDLRNVNLAVRALEQYLGEITESMFKASNSQRY